MKGTSKIVVAMLAAGLTVAGCAGGQGGPNTGQVAGGAGGAVLGGLAGSQIGSGSGKLIATGAGAVIGALVGSEIGRRLTEGDEERLTRTTQDTLENNPTGKTSTWENPDTGHRGEVTPTDTYQRSDGRYCREFSHTIYVGGEPEQAYGTACRQPDGSWKIVS
jgi:surface antigen